MPHLVATFNHLSQIYSYYIMGDRSPLTTAAEKPLKTCYWFVVHTIHYFVHASIKYWRVRFAISDSFLFFVVAVGDVWVLLLLLIGYCCAAAIVSN